MKNLSPVFASSFSRSLQLSVRCSDQGPVDAPAKARNCQDAPQALQAVQQEDSTPYDSESRVVVAGQALGELNQAEDVWPSTFGLGDLL